jgi:hypothetical protein
MKTLPKTVSLNTAIKTRLEEAEAPLIAIKIGVEQIEAIMEEDPDHLNWSHVGSLYYVVKHLENIIEFLG